MYGSWLRQRHLPILIAIGVAAPTIAIVIIVLAGILAVRIATSLGLLLSSVVPTFLVPTLLSSVPLLFLPSFALPSTTVLTFLPRL